LLTSSRQPGEYPFEDPTAFLIPYPAPTHMSLGASIVGRPAVGAAEDCECISSHKPSEACMISLS